MKRGDEALNASSLHRFIPTISDPTLNVSSPLLIKRNHRLTLHCSNFFKEIHRLTLHRRYFLKQLCPPLLRPIQINKFGPQIIS
jgi:hypothetical protein